MAQQADIQLTVKLIDEATRPMKEMTRLIDEQLRVVKGQVALTDRAFRQINTTLRGVHRNVARVAQAWRMLYGIMAAYAGLSIARSLIEISDQYQLLSARLRLVTSSQEEFLHLQEELYRVAQETRSSYATTVEVYTRIARALQYQGVEQSKVLKIVQALNYAILASGLNAQEAQAGLIQLSQAFASGRLQGEEFRSVMENLPPVAQAIADYLGVDIGKLYELREQGKLTSDVLTNALIASLDRFKQQAQSLPMTVGQAWQELENSWQRLTGTVSQSGHVFDHIKATFLALAKTMDQIHAGKLAKDFQALGAIGAATFKVMSYGAEAVLQVINALRFGWLGVKRDILETQKAIIRVMHTYYSVSTKILEYANRLPGLKHLVPDSAIAWGRGQVAWLEKWLSNTDKLLADVNKEIERSKGSFGALHHLFGQLRTNFDEALKQLAESGQAANEQLNNVAQNAKKATDAVIDFNKEEKKFVQEYIDSLKQQEIQQRKQEELAQKVFELQHKLYLDLLPKGQREIEQINTQWAQYVYVLEDAYRAGAITEEQYSSLVALLNQWQDKQVEAVKAGQSAHRQAASEIERLWQHTYERLTDIVADWIYQFDFSLKDVLDLFKRTTAQMLATWIMTQLRMAAVGYAQSHSSSFIAKIISFFTGPSQTASAPKRHEGGYITKYHAGGLVEAVERLNALIPRFHWGGLAHDEVPAILQTGEYVVSRKGVEFLDRINRGEWPFAQPQISVQVNIHNETGMPVKAVNRGTYFDGRRLVTDIILQDLHENGPIRQALKEVVQ